MDNGEMNTQFVQFSNYAESYFYNYFHDESLCLLDCEKDNLCLSLFDGVFTSYRDLLELIKNDLKIEKAMCGVKVFEPMYEISKMTVKTIIELIKYRALAINEKHEEKRNNINPFCTDMKTQWTKSRIEYNDKKILKAYNKLQLGLIDYDGYKNLMIDECYDINKYITEKRRSANEK